MPGIGLFSNQGQAQGNLIQLGGGLSESSPDFWRARAGLGLGEYQLQISHQESTWDRAGWPKRFVQTNFSAGKTTFLKNGKLLSLGLGLGVSAEKNQKTYSYLEPNGQIMYLSPPPFETSGWGYGLGLAAMTNSPFGSGAIPLLMAIYQGQGWRVQLGFPIFSTSIDLMPKMDFEMAIAPFGIQRAGLKYQILDWAEAALVYKTERQLYSHVEELPSNNQIESTVRRIGTELTVSLSGQDVRIGLEAGHQLNWTYSEVKKGTQIVSEPVRTSSERGGAYANIVAEFRF